jgi:hypothetical protein
MAVTGTVLNQTTTYYGPSTTLYPSGGSAGPNETVTVLWQEGSWYYIEYSTASGDKRLYITTSAVTSLSGSVSSYTPTLIPRYVGFDGNTYCGPDSSQYVSAGTVSKQETVYNLSTKFWNDYAMIEYDIPNSQKKRAWYPDSQLGVLQGVDTSAPLSQATANAVYAAGYAFIMRYYTQYDYDKKLTLPEAQRICDAGLQIVSVYQDANNSPSCFDADKGTDDATKAYDYARDIIGQPQTSVIYFAVDYDASLSDINGCINDYFTSVRSVFNSHSNYYRVGVYGSGLVCDKIFNEFGLAQRAYLGEAVGYAGSSSYTETWNIIQTLPPSTFTINNHIFHQDMSKTFYPGWSV